MKSTQTHLPAPLGQLVCILHLRDVDANHGLTKALAHLSENLRVLVVGYSLYDGLGALLRVTGLENTRANEDTVTAQLHHESGISGSGHTAGSEVDNGKTAFLSTLADKLVGSFQLTGISTELRLRVSGRLENSAGTGDISVDSTHVLDGLNNISGAGLTLGADHGSTFRNAAESLPKVAAAANEGGLEVVLRDVV